MVLSTEVYKLLLWTQYITIYKNNLLHVGGLLKSSDLALNCHSQIMIDKGHPVAPLVVKHFHETNLHCGREQTLSSMRQ